MAKKEPTKSFVLRIDSEMMDAIEAWAADEFRSTNGQIQWILAEALKKSGRMKKSRKAEDKTDCNHSIFRYDNFIGCFSADKIKMSVRK